MNSEPRVLHITTGLERGGAERQLTLLSSHLPNSSMVFSIREPGPMARELDVANVPLASGGAQSVLSPLWVSRLHKVVKQWQPDIVMGWMYHGNLATSLTRLFGFRGPLFWNVRHSVARLAEERRATQAVIKLGACVSKIPDNIVYNSEVAASQHEALGYCSESRIVIDNGFDTERFRPDDVSRMALRRELGLSDDAWLLGVVGRAHPMKNHKGWLDAVVMLKEAGCPIHCLMVGTGVDDPAFVEEVRKRNLGDMVSLRPATATPETLYPALDLLVLPSRWGEAFPNVVGEAMACGVPALVTNVGDASRVVGETGFVSAEATPEALAATTLDVLSRGREVLGRYGASARQRVVTQFSEVQTVKNYQDLWVKE